MQDTVFDGRCLGRTKDSYKKLVIEDLEPGTSIEDVVRRLDPSKLERSDSYDPTKLFKYVAYDFENIESIINQTGEEWIESSLFWDIPYTLDDIKEDVKKYGSNWILKKVAYAPEDPKNFIIVFDSPKKVS